MTMSNTTTTTSRDALIPDRIDVSVQHLARAFDEWERRRTDDPQWFEEVIRNGSDRAAYLGWLLVELSAGTDTDTALEQEVAGRNDAATCMTVTVYGCQRCGEKHAALPFRPLGNPVDAYGYWGVCPNTGQPISMAIMEAPERAGGTGGKA